MSDLDYKTLYLELVGRLEGWAVTLLDPRGPSWNLTRKDVACELRKHTAALADLPRRETSASIAQWQRETFGEATTTCERIERASYAMDGAMRWAMTSVAGEDRNSPNLSRAIRAAEEMAELIRLLAQDDDDPKAPEECADIDIVLRGIDAVHKVERTDTVDAKMAINRARKWTLTADGHGQHVEEVKP